MKIAHHIRPDELLSAPELVDLLVAEESIGEGRAGHEIYSAIESGEIAIVGGKLGRPEDWFTMEEVPY